MEKLKKEKKKLKKRMMFPWMMGSESDTSSSHESKKIAWKADATEDEKQQLIDKLLKENSKKKSKDLKLVTNEQENRMSNVMKEQLRNYITPLQE